MTEAPRPEAIQAIVDAYVDLDLRALQQLQHLTPEERQAGIDAMLEVMQATSGDRERTVRVWDLLVDGGARADMDWADAWRVQPEANRRMLADLYDVLPQELLPLIDEWRAEQ